MWYLFIQIWVWLLLSFIVGWLANWFFCCRSCKETNVEYTAKTPVVSESKPIISNKIATNEAVNVSPVQDAPSTKPQLFSTPPSSTDDLKRIKGIGSVIEKTLNELGIFQFSQIAKFNSENITWVEKSISFPGRVSRENWVSQAKILSTGGSTDFAKRVDKGDVGY